MKASVILLLFLTLGSPSVALAGGLALPPPDPTMGTIALSLRAKAQVGPNSVAVQVRFVRLDDDTDLLEVDSLVRSNFFDSKQIYLLNCKPGRYAVVGAVMGATMANDEFKLVLDPESIMKTEITVAAGELVFMGDLLVDVHHKIDRADQTQAHLLRLLEPQQPHQSVMGRIFAPQESTRLALAELRSVDRSSQAQRAFFEIATRKAFKKEPAWRQAIQRRDAGQ